MLKNITLSADQNLIHKAREKARLEHTTLNAQFRQWLERYATADMKTDAYKSLMSSLGYARPGSHFTRDVMNER